MNDLLIHCENLTKLYGLVIGVNDVTLSLLRGVHGLLGPNGAGKSTFLKLITGQLRPSGGAIRVLGESPWNNAPLFRRVGFCPEQDAFYDFMTGLEFVETLCSLNGYPREEARARARKALERVGMSDGADRKIKTYSKGMRQRTKLAQALAHDPELLVLDEPLSGLDPQGRYEMMRLIQQLGREGKSLVISSHILHEVETMTGDFLLIASGRVLAAGNVREIRSLMEEYPHRITLRCDRAKDLARELIAEFSLAGLELDGDRGALTLHTHRPADLYARLPAIVTRGDFVVSELTAQDENLEAVFNYLMEIHKS